MLYQSSIYEKPVERKYCKSIKYGVNIIQRNYGTALDKRDLSIAENGNSSSKFN